MSESPPRSGTRWFERFSRIRRESRAVLWGLGALLVVLGVLFYLLEKSDDVPAYLVQNRVLLFALWYFCIVLTLAIAFVLLRNLFKLALERRNRILGSKFKTKLVATYVGLSLIPVLLLFAIATELLQGSIDRWFNTPARPALEQGNAVAQELLDRVERTTVAGASRLLGEMRTLDLADDAVRKRLADRIQVLRSEGDVDFLSIYEGSEFVQGVVDPRSGLGDLPEPGRDLLAEAESEGRATRWMDAPSGRGRLVLAAVASAPPSDGAEAELATRIAVAGSFLDPTLSERVAGLLSSYQSFRQLEVQRDDLRASHLLIFLTVTLLILLASSWVGLFLARRITVPIQALAEGTKRISGGDLGHRVTVAADDELGVLVESFNRMTELLERGNLELQTSNRRLADERALLAAVLENVAAGVLSIDGSGKILTVNAAALRMLRQGEAEVIGREVETAWGDPERAKLGALVAGSIASGTDRDGRDGRGGRDPREIQMLLGGDWRTFEVKITPLVDPSGGGARVVVLEELTDLIKAQQLAAWTEAARRIAHEIKNPLTPIRLAAERLLEKHRSGGSDLGRALEEGVETIVREVVAMQGMVDEFSRYARMPRPRPERIDLGKLIEETVHLYRDVKAGVEVTASISAEAGDAWLDREQIRRALINLLDNAVEAVDPPGSVEVTARKSADGERRGGRLEISVADTGRGIPAAAKDKLFLPYYSTKGRGTGMGLAIVHRIVADHQGSIRVEDRVPQGTVFTIELPLG